MAAVATAVVVSRSPSPAELPTSSGSTVSVLCLCSPESADVFRKVVESELDDTPRSTFRREDGRDVRVEVPGYRLVFRTVAVDDATLPAEQQADALARRFASTFAAAVDSDHRGFAGAVLDGVGLRALALHVDRPGPREHVPAFVVALSPTPGEGDFPHWTCAPAKGATATAPAQATFPSLADHQSALQKVARAVVLQGMETPYPRLQTADGVTAWDVPDRKFHVYDETAVCPPQKAGALTDQQYKDIRAERLAAEGEQLEARAQAPAFLRIAEATRGRKLCNGLLRDAVDTSVAEFELQGTRFQQRLAKADAWVDDKGDALRTGVGALRTRLLRP